VRRDKLQLACRRRVPGAWTGLSVRRRFSGAGRPCAWWRRRSDTPASSPPPFAGRLRFFFRHRATIMRRRGPAEGQRATNRLWQSLLTKYTSGRRRGRRGYHLITVAHLGQATADEPATGYGLLTFRQTAWSFGGTANQPWAVYLPAAFSQRCFGPSAPRWWCCQTACVVRGGGVCRGNWRAVGAHWPSCLNWRPIPASPSLGPAP